MTKPTKEEIKIITGNNFHKCMDLIFDYMHDDEWIKEAHKVIKELSIDDRDMCTCGHELAQHVPHTDNECVLCNCSKFQKLIEDSKFKEVRKWVPGTYQYKDGKRIHKTGHYKKIKIKI